MQSPLWILFAASLVLLPSAAEGHAKDRGPEAQELVRDGRNRYSEGSLGQRRIALRELEQAALLAPHDTRVLGELGRAYLDAGFTHDAMETFERITRLEPANADAWYGLGQVWKRDWLATLAPASLGRTIECFGNCARLQPDRAEAWTALSVMRVEQGDAPGAAICARLALAADPDGGGAPLASAYLDYHTGRVAEAESLFTLAIGRLAPPLAARFRDVTSLVPKADGDRLADMTPVERAEFTRRFWSESDPDPTTRTNEARVEYWARVAHAVLLFSDPWSPHWDMRAELYTRYGSPEHVGYPPAGIPLARRPNTRDNLFSDGMNGVRYIGDADPMWYPMHTQIWDYPRLGMSVVLEDLAISGNYELPRDPYRDTDPVPDPAALARNGLLATNGGRAAFKALPPGVQPLEVNGLVSTFEGERGPRLLAHVAVPASPDQALVAECVVIDSSEREVARSSRALSASRCDPVELRAGDFAFDLPAGSYRLGLSVSEGDSARGVLRVQHDLAAVSGRVTMSDVVLLCGPLDVSPLPGAVRLDPNLDARIGAEEPLLAYFEVYHLQPDAAGETRFEYEYKVEPLRADTRPWFRRLFSRQWSDQITVKSSEQGIGPTRRQYVTVPAQSLPPGRYRLEITIHDRVAGRSTRRVTEFVKSGFTTSSALVR
jgi:GWxTD domain-containing protein